MADHFASLEKEIAAETENFKKLSLLQKDKLEQEVLKANEKTELAEEERRQAKVQHERILAE